MYGEGRDSRGDTVLLGKYCLLKDFSTPNERSETTCLMTQHHIPYDFILHLCCENVESYKTWFIEKCCKMSMVYEWVSMKHWWKDTDRAKLKYWEKNIIQCGW